MAIVAFPSTFALCKDKAGKENVVKGIFKKLTVSLVRVCNECVWLIFWMSLWLSNIDTKPHHINNIWIIIDSILYNVFFEDIAFILPVMGETICTTSHDAETFAYNISLKIVFLPITFGFFFQMLWMLDWISFSFWNICPSHVSEPLDSQPLNVHPDPLHWVSKTAVCEKKIYYFQCGISRDLRHLCGLDIYLYHFGFLLDRGK